MTICRLPRSGSSTSTNGERAIVALLVLVLVVGCSDRATTALRGDGDRASTPGVIVSAPLQPPARSGSVSSSRVGTGASASLGGTVAYVSLPPGSVPGGVTATMRNAANSESITEPMTDGGFDPVAVPAGAGDELTIGVADSGGSLLVSWSLAVPGRRPPTIVRTDPPRGKTDVPLNNVIAVVFSEPVDATNLSGSVQLLRGAQAVAGIVRLEPSGLLAEFIPDNPLDPETAYELVVDTSVRNLRGDALDAAVHVSFTTGDITFGAGGRALFVANDGRGTNTVDGSFPISQHGILVYRGANTPAAIVAGANTGISDLGPSGIAVDGAGRLYVAQSGGGDAILIYAAGATGNVAPVDTIFGSNTGLSYPQGVAIDAGGRLYVANIAPPPANLYSITVYAPGASGNATPIAAIQGSNTGLNVPIGIAVDAAGRLYVANLGSITVYARGANGNATPIATIQGSSTGLDRPIGIAVDGSGNIYADNFLPCGHDVATQSILVFAAGTTGNASPIATIQGNDTGLDGAYGIAVDAAGQLYVANATSCPAVMTIPSPSSLGSITVYAPAANGNVSPIARLAGSVSGLFGPTWISF